MKFSQKENFKILSNAPLILSGYNEVIPFVKWKNELVCV